jgi:hypothetical protein
MSDQNEPNPAKFPAQAKWRSDNPEKVWAQRALRSAIKAGLVRQQPCHVCGDPDAEAHHHDYSKPADVVWLCRKHHKAAHRQLRAEGC